ncbi:MAG: hypothetical protein ACKVOP_00825 [Sphingomonadaceae bacterium]
MVRSGSAIVRETCNEQIQNEAVASWRDLMFSIASFGPLPVWLRRSEMQAASLSSTCMAIEEEAEGLEFLASDWRAATRAARLALCADVVRRCAALRASAPADLVWTFSGERLAANWLAAIADQWTDGAPPVDALIGIRELPSWDRSSRYQTSGLTAFVDHELTVTIACVNDTRDALRDLLLIARHALATGPISQNDMLQGIRGPIAFAATALHGSYWFELVPETSKMD